MFKERIIQVFFISIILIVVCIFYLPKRENKKVDYEKFWIEKTFSGNDYDMLILGDSRAYRGISPFEIEKTLLEIKVLNFGYSSGRLNKFMYKEAEKHLNQNSKQRIILLAIAPNTLTKAPVEDEQYMSLLTLPKEEVIQRTYLAPMLNHFVPISLEDMLLLKKDLNSKKENYIEEFHNNGWVASYMIEEDTTEALETYQVWFSKTKVEDELIEDLIYQTKEWVNKGIKVFGFRPPVSSSMKQIEDSLSDFNENLLRTKFEKAGGKWIVLDKNIYHSYDGSHIDKNSAIELSKDIAIYIKNHI